MPFSLVQNVYLSAGVATRRATKINMNICLSSLKNFVRYPISNKVTDVRACKVYENGLLKNEFTYKKIISFFRKHTDIC